MCANEWSPSDGRVVSLDHGCGAHSETDVEHPEPTSVGDPIVDEFAVDLEPAEAAEPAQTSDEQPADKAQPYWRSYVELEPHGTWSEIARRHL